MLELALGLLIAEEGMENSKWVLKQAVTKQSPASACRAEQWQHDCMRDEYH